jgi:hypothetical protein
MVLQEPQVTQVIMELQELAGLQVQMVLQEQQVTPVLMVNQV